MGVTVDGWVEHAIRVSNPRSGGGTYQTGFYPYPWRIVVHEIQGDDRLSMIRSHPYPPHVWYDPASRDLHQTVPFTRSAFALYQAGDAPHYTNKARSLQVELAGMSEDTPWEPVEWLTNIALDVVVPMCQWAAMQGGQINLSHVTGPFVIANSARVNAPQRFDPQFWADFDGVCGHAHVPMGDDHWDPGAMDLQRIAHHAALVIAGLLAPTQLLEDDVARLVKTPDGSVWSTDGVVATPLDSPTYGLVRKLGLVPPEPEWGVGVSWEEMGQLLVWDGRTDSLRPFKVRQDPAAGVRPGGAAAVVNSAEVAAVTLGLLKSKL